MPLDGLGVILLLGTAGAVCSSSASGVVLARVGLRPTVMLVGTIAALGSLAAALSPAFWTFLVAATALGVATGLLDSSLNTAVALSGRNRLLNALHGFYGVGTTIGPLVVTAAILAVSWRPAYGVLLVAETGLVVGWWAVGRYNRRTGVAAVPAGNSAGTGPLQPVVVPAEPPGRQPAGTTTNGSPAPPRARRRLVPTVSLGLVVFMLYTGFEVSAGQWGRASNGARSASERLPQVSPRSATGVPSLWSGLPWPLRAGPCRNGSWSTWAAPSP